MQQDVDPHSGLRDARHDRNEDGRPSGALAADAAGQGLSAVPHSTHFDAHGQAHMVDVGDKASTRRIARAQGRITMSAQAFAMVRDGTAGKGDVLGVARVAAIQGTKRTAELIPLCHPLALTRVAVEFTLRDQEKAIAIEVTAETTGPTGVEMEALTGACVGLLTVYDMCKSVDRGMRIAGVHLVEKAGGKSGHYLLDELPSDTAR